MTEFQKLISKLTLGDTLKITMSANISSLGSKDPNNKENTETIESIRYKCMGNKIGDYMPNDIPKVINDENDLVKILARSIQFASERGAESLLGLEPALLSLFTYKDGVRMITATVRIMNKVDLSLLKVIDWEFTPDSWQNITKIEIPELSVKERLHLDSLLPSENVEDIHTQLSFKLHTKHEDSLNMLKSYAAHYRRYPGYQIVA